MTDLTNRRRAERIQLPEAIEAEFFGIDVMISEIGLLGARLEHTAPLADEDGEGELFFRWRGEVIAIRGRIVRSEWFSDTRGNRLYRTGVEFSGASPASGALLREFIAFHVTRMLHEQKANARGERTVFDDDFTPFVRSFSLGQNEERRNAPRYISCRFEAPSTWRVTTSLSPKQPLDGFLVSEKTPAAEVELLKRSYLEADAAGRRVIRALAEMSLTEDNATIPPAKLK